MRREIERLFRQAYYAHVEIDLKLREGSEECDRHLDDVLWPRLYETHDALVALERHWPREWRGPISHWCLACAVWRRPDPGALAIDDEDDAGDALDQASEELGLLLQIAHALALREARDVERAKARHARALRRARARRDGAVLLEQFQAGGRRFWSAAGPEVEAARVALVSLAMTLKLDAVFVTSRQHTLGTALRRATGAVLDADMFSRLGLVSDETWRNIEAEMDALADAIAEPEPDPIH